MRTKVVFFCCFITLLFLSTYSSAQTHDDDVYTIIGDADLMNGFEWDAKATVNDMSAKGNIYELTVKNRYLVKTSSTQCHERYRYAVVKNHDITVSYPNILVNGEINKNRGKTDNSLSQTGNYDIVFTYDPSTSNLTANFVLVKSEDNPSFTVTLTVNNSALGSVTGSGTYECGKSVNITATPTAGSIFSSWSDGNTSANRYITPTGDISLQAIFTSNDNVYTMVGDPELMNNNANWNTSETQNDMTLQSDGNYTLTVANKYLVKSNNSNCHERYYFAVVSNHDMNTSMPNVMYNNTIERTWASNTGSQISQTGIYNITFTFKPTSRYATATFTLVEAMDNPTYTITISSNDESLGTVTGGGTFECGKGVNITAKPNPGSTFVKWSDGNTSASRTIYPGSDTDIYAIFQVNDNSYTIIGDPEITNANADWDPASEDNVMTLLDDGTYQLIVKNKYLVKTSSSQCHGHYYCAVVANHDITTVKPISVYYYSEIQRTNGTNDGSQIKQTGIYDITYTFKSTDSRPKVQYNLVESQPNPTYKITINTNDPTMGSASGSGTYECGESVTIEATPAAGYTFTKWSDINSTNPNSKRTIYPTSDTTITANFSGVRYILIGDPELMENGASWDVSSTENEMILQDDGTYQLVMEDRYLVKTSASPWCHAKYYFAVSQNGDITKCKPYVEWNGAIERTWGTDDGYQIKQTGKYRITFTYKEGDKLPKATFTLVESMPNPSYNFTFKSADETMGTVIATDGEYECGEAVNFKAVANTNYRFTKWSDGNTSASRTIYANNNMDLIAYFEPYVWTLIGDLAIVNGDIPFDPTETLNDMTADNYKWEITIMNKVLTTCGSPYKYRAVLNHDMSEVRPKNTFELLNITKNGLYNLTFSMREWDSSPSVKTELIEEYGKDDKFTVELTVSNTAYGSVVGSGEYNCGEVFKIEAKPNDGYKFKEWSDGNTDAQRDLLADRDLQLTAIFECETDDCSGPKEVYLDYDATEVPEQYKDAQPIWTAYPPALDGKIKTPDCE